MSYKVVIPSAGLGSRLGSITKYVPKALVSIGTKPAISRIIEMFPKDCEFIIPVGYKGELIKEYIYLTYPELNVKFVDVLLYSGEGSGLGYTLNQCKEYLQAPFVFCSCDTIVTNDIPAPTFNWMAWDDRDSVLQYRTISINNNDIDNLKVASINDKGKNLDKNPKPYIGLCGIYDYKLFWNTMNDDEECINTGECYGLNSLIEKGITPLHFNWFDLGIQVELETTRNKFEKESNVNILPKEDEAIWLVNDKAIKFHNDPDFISKRIKRSKELGSFIPKILNHTTHMYSSELIKGSVLSNCVNESIFNKFLNYSNTFWTKYKFDEKEMTEFYESCKYFYVDKTLDRVQKFYKKFNHIDEALEINGKKYPSFNKIWNMLDIRWICEGVPARYHGDYHFENIMYDEKTKDFKMLDWRQGFGNYKEDKLNIGDIYYDFAKLLHGLIISHELIHLNLFDVKWENNIVTFDYNRKQKLIDCEQEFYKWLEKEGWDVKKVKVLTALIFLNIAALHHYNYCELLYILGLTMLYDNIKGGKINE